MHVRSRNLSNNEDKNSGISMPFYKNFSLTESLGLDIAEHPLPPVSSKVPKISLFYGIHETKFGPGLIVNAHNTLAGFYFLEDSPPENIANFVAPNFKSMDLILDPPKTRPLLERILANQPMSITLMGSPFEIAVWKALLQIPKGYVTHYQAIARAVGKPQAVRAVASAIGRNPLSWVVPCHRVIRSNGKLGGYRFGLNKKLELLQQEVLYKPHNFKT